MNSAAAQPRKSLLPVVTAFAALGGFLFGYDTGVISGAIGFIADEFDLNSFEQGVVTSSVLAGAFFGAGLSGVTADKYGRRRLLISAGAIYVVGAIAAALSPSVELLVASRFVLGLGIGITSTVAPLYIAEMAPASRRGGLVATYQLAITIGILVADLVDEALSHPGGWRWAFGLAAIPGAVQFIGMSRMPASPRWLIGQHRDADATVVMKQVGASDDEARAEIAAMQEAVEEEREGSWADLLSPGVKAALAVGVMLALIQQITGINTVIYYAPDIFEDARFGSAQSAIWATVVVSSVNVLATFVAIRYLDRWGRIPLLTAGLTGMIVSLFALGGTFIFLDKGEDGGALGIVAVFFVCTYIASFAFSLGPIVWVIVSEIFPTKVRGRAISVATMVNWGANFIVGLMFLTLVDELHTWGTFWLFGALSIGSLWYIRAKVPETKGRTLEEIEESWKS